MSMTGSVASRSNAAEVKYVPVSVSEAAEDVEFSAGWGQTGVLGKLDNTYGEETLPEAPADLRTNLAETAFFYPQLRTNEQG